MNFIENCELFFSAALNLIVKYAVEKMGIKGKIGVSIKLLYFNSDGLLIHKFTKDEIREI